MSASRLAWGSVVVCVACACANAFFYLADPNYPPSWGSRWQPVVPLAVVYALLGLLAWSQRKGAGPGAVVLSACLLPRWLCCWAGARTGGAHRRTLPTTTACCGWVR
jgi:hypothetical protein